MTAHPLVIDPAVFDPRNAEPDLVAMNADITALQKARPSPWSLPLDKVRAARRQGLGTFPLPSPDPLATVVQIRGRDGHAIPARIFRPASGAAAGTFLHFHGGGWVFGEASEGDLFLRHIADRTGLAVASIDYRLAPEHRFPAGPDDCEDAALALIEGGLADADGVLPTGFLAIGGESAGAHLSVVTLLRLRDRHGLTPFHAANLTAGCYDLSLTPSVRRFGAERLVLNTEDVAAFVDRFLPPGLDPRSPEVSPLHAALHDLPPALFTCGTRDLVIDDTLFMATRWLAGGNAADLSLHAGGCHVFQGFPSATGIRSIGEMADFLGARMTEHLARDDGGWRAVPFHA